MSSEPHIPIEDFTAAQTSPEAPRFEDLNPTQPLLPFVPAVPAGLTQNEDFTSLCRILLELGIGQLLICAPPLLLLAGNVLLEIRTKGRGRGGGRQDAVQLVVALLGISFYYLTPGLLRWALPARFQQNIVGPLTPIL